ncbi:MAG TPA: hypothetical protein VEU30_04030, partial [Thermoanaerobaculia bacterium]|nr:hypothetical protein [Thermoanaerobaculia bacterium]
PQSFASMDRLLRSVWSGFVDVLAAGDPDASLEWLAGEATRAKYRGPLRLIEARLPELAASLRTLYAVSIGGDTAHYLVTRPEEGRTFGYHVYFARDARGLWKVVQF